MLKLFTDPQNAAAIRNIVSAIAGVLVTLGVLSIGQSQQIIGDLSKILESLGTIIVAGSTLMAALAPVINAIYASRRADPVEQAKTAAAVAVDPSNPKAGDVQAQIIAAAPTIITAPPPESKADADKVKVALLDATAALPEVVGKINVTDETLAANTNSEQVVKAA